MNEQQLNLHCRVHHQFIRQTIKQIMNFQSVRWPSSFFSGREILASNEIHISSRTNYNHRMETRVSHKINRIKAQAAA